MNWTMVGFCPFEISRGRRMNLRILIAGLSLLAAAPVAVQARTAQTQTAPVPAAAAADIAATHLMVPSPDGRTIDMSVWTAPDEKGVVVFSHGWGGAPASYERVFSAWARHGFTVIAPLHLDSQQHPQHVDDSRVAFMTRLMDVAVARGVARRTHAGKPIVAAGYSFGSLIAMIEGGAATPAGPIGDPDVKGIIAFSTPGDTPGLVRPDTYAAMTTPLLVITGDQDTVPDFVSDPADHRHPFERSPAGDKTLITYAGATHSMIHTIDEADLALLIEATENFLDAYALDDAAAKARLAALPAPDGVTIERR
jgi:alpha-beta hydrolase superfamily lysophospholipase